MQHDCIFLASPSPELLPRPAEPSLLHPAPCPAQAARGVGRVLAPQNGARCRHGQGAPGCCCLVLCWQLKCHRVPLHPTMCQSIHCIPSLQSHPTPSHLIPSHPVPSYPSHSTPSHPPHLILPHPIPLNFNTFHPTPLSYATTSWGNSGRFWVSVDHCQQGNVAAVLYPMHLLGQHGPSTSHSKWAFLGPTPPTEMLSPRNCQALFPHAELSLRLKGFSLSGIGAGQKNLEVSSKS